MSKSNIDNYKAEAIKEAEAIIEEAMKEAAEIKAEAIKEAAEIKAKAIKGYLAKEAEVVDEAFWKGLVFE